MKHLGGCGVTILALLAAGCSGHHGTAGGKGGFTRVVTPQPPGFLTGPLSLLLTNWAGFSARVEVQAQSSLDSDRNSSGQLLGRGTKLLYAPEAGEIPDGHRQPGGYSFIWDLAENRGYVLSEALQAYAPVSSDLRVTNLAIQAANIATQRFSGHPCDSATATARTADGTAAEFELLRAMDLNGFPVRIQAVTRANPITLNFSKVRLEPPPAEVFSPPDGFTKYPTPESMADEIAARQQNLSRKNREPIQPIPGEGTPQRRY